MIKAELNILTERCEAVVKIKGERGVVEEDVRCVRSAMYHKCELPKHYGWLADGTCVTWTEE